jgi:hypothetical protein
VSAILATVNDVLRDPRVWQGRGHHVVRTEPTGHAALDASLPGGGWPVGALTEILHDLDGTQELGLALPLIARLTHAQRRVILVDPPYLPYAPAFAAAGVRMACLHVLRDCEVQALWATDQCLRSGICAAVLCWPRQPQDKQLRRLQLAAETSSAVGFLFRPARAAQLASPAALRIAVSTDGIRVLKCRGGMVRAQTIALPHAASGRC